MAERIKAAVKGGNSLLDFINLGFLISHTFILFASGCMKFNIE